MIKTTETFTPRIAVIGTGNVATHLVLWLEKVGIRVSQANPHTFEGFDSEADICLVAVSDKAIWEVACKADRRLSACDCVMVHTSGTTPLKTLSALKRPVGVLYPMQTFTKGRILDYSDIPLFVEGDSAATTRILMSLAECMSSVAIKADSDARAHIHMGAVYACNFLNHLLAMATRCIGDTTPGLEIYRQLVMETVDKAFTNGPDNAQTGPARRDDNITMQTHLSLLADDKDMADVYRLLSRQIKNKYQ